MSNLIRFFNIQPYPPILESGFLYTFFKDLNKGVLAKIYNNQIQVWEGWVKKPSCPYRADDYL